MMDSTGPGPLQLRWDRRCVLTGSAAALVALMVGAARALPAAQLRADPRRGFVDWLCQLVIPDTDTPGAGKAGAADFVLLAIDHGMEGLKDADLMTLRTAMQAPEAGNFPTTAAANELLR